MPASAAPTTTASPVSSPTRSASSSRSSGDVRRLLFANGSSLALVPPDYVEPPSDTLLGFLVDDVEAATAELAAKGIEPDGELNAGYGFRYRHFRAPDGRRFELLDRRA